jgi:protein ImuB
VLAQPLRLATRAHRPIYQGVLHLLTGPHRVEGGWWHRFEAVDTGAIGPVPPAFGGQSTSGSVAAGPAAAKPGGVEPVAVSAATASVSPASLSTAHTTAAPLVAREPVTGHVQRDYWVALSEHAGVLWVFQERLADDDTAWYLHGVFA